jgi:AraC-like DNA-binding protein
MTTISITDSIAGHARIKSGAITFVHFKENIDRNKYRYVFDQYAISFVLNGKKEIFGATENTIVTAGQGILTPQGNAILSDHRLQQNEYARIILLFPVDLVRDFLIKHQLLLDRPNPQANKTSHLHFTCSSYLREYVKNITGLIRSGDPLSYPLALHKLEELLLALYESYREPLIALLSQHIGGDELSLKSIVESNLFTNLTLGEMAFLSNRSLSSFKRGFEKAYGLSPQRYIRERKMDIARIELSAGKRPGDLYLTYGYDSLSNFDTAFKRRFGVSPSAYHQNSAI